MKANRLLLILSLLLSIAVSAQNRKIYLASGAIEPQPNVHAAAVDSFNRQSARQGQKTFAVLQFASIPDAIMRSQLSAAGIELLEYLPEHAYTVTINGSLDLPSLQRAGAVAFLELSPLQKMESRLKTGIPAWASRIPGTVDLWVAYPRSYTAEEVIQNLRAMNADVLPALAGPARTLAVRVAVTRVQSLAALPCIEYVQLAPRGDQTLNFNSRSASRANSLNASVANGGKGLKGEGVVLGVGDNADVQTHIDFAGRLINRSPYLAAGHGHHVTGTAGGAGNGNDFYRGYAPKATIISQGFNGILRNASSYVTDYGMVITNNSYGDNVECSYYGTYDLYSRWMDQMAFDLPYLQNIFAAGNSGGSSCFPFQPTYHTVLGGYQSAKNVLTVGATNDSGAVSGFSSKGPVKDGRTKPEITAMGQFVASAWPTSYYSYNNGTSMASPAVAGGAALLYQRYRQLNGGANPKNALVKALLCNGSSDRGNNGPDYQYGFGWMNLLRSVDMMENNRIFSGNVANNITATHTVNVPASVAQLKVLLYWNDPAASPLSAKTLVNDLDLEVVNGATTVLPRILDTANTGLTIPSVEGEDHRNNMEQVIINNPSAGTYTIRVKGTTITQNPAQEYFVVYDMLPAGQMKITSPAGGDTWVPSFNALSRMKISWEAFGFSSGTVTISFSADNGANWSTVATNVDINRVIYTWYVPAVSTTEALIRITKDGTGETVTSDPFIIMPQPVVTEGPVQCEGYYMINWTTVPGVTDYEVMMLSGDEMKPVAATTSNTYTFSGLNKDSVYWVTVRPRINGKAGMRAVAISRTATGGSCAGAISDNDLKLDAIVTPVSGRKFTSTQPSSASVVTVQIKNLDDAPQTGCDVKYSINGSPFITETINATIAAGAVYTHSFATAVDLSATGSYQVVAVVKNHAADPVAVNDTISKKVKHIDNQPLNLTSYFIDQMETAQDLVYTKDTLGLEGLERYDYSRTTAMGRLRSFINSGMALSGSRALTLDISANMNSGNTNYLFGTYNLVNYSTAANDLRFDFQYNNHGQSAHVNNMVWIRGSDVDPWIPVYNLFTEQADPGTYKKSESIEISDILAANGQVFTPGFAVRWGQYGTMPATDRYYAGGYSIDDVRVYQVFNDLQMKNIDEPGQNSCALTTASVVKVSVRNSANNAISNIPVRYRINNGTWISETIPSIPANTTIQYSFTATADMAATGTYTIQAVVDYSSDSFHENDTMTTSIVNSPVISTFPHLEDFENGNGYWYARGKNSSWEYGTPASSRVNRAASGARAWKTRLAGYYNDGEFSYLYSPCYNVSSLTKPMLSFSLALDLEDCGTTLCDGAWVEYSADGNTWTKLGSSGNGTNWYNKSTDQLWSVQNYHNWHVATTALPAGLNSLRLRFVFKSDPAVNRDGIAVDDIHIYDSIQGIYDGPTMTGTVNAAISSNSWTHFTSNGKLVASVQTAANTGSAAVQAFINNGPVRFTASQYYHDRNIIIQPAASFADSMRVRYYFLDREVDSLLKATGCATCSKPSSAYGLGVSVYTDPDKSLENGSIGDNNQGMWQFLPSTAIKKVPFDKGYYFEFVVKDAGEFWLNAGGLDGSTPLPVKMMEFTAQKNGADAGLTWKVAAETDVLHYAVELARGQEALQQSNWEELAQVTSQGNTTGTRTYQYADTEANKMGTRYYRIKTVNQNGSFVYSPVRSLNFDAPVLWQVYPNPSNGLFYLTYDAAAGELLTARVVDAKGRTVQVITVTGNGQVNQLKLDLTLMSRGVYLLQLQAKGRKESFKLFKH